MMHEHALRKPLALVAALIAALALSVAGLGATATPALAATGEAPALVAANLQAAATADYEYSIDLDGVAYASETGVFGVPGEKMTLKAVTTKTNLESYDSTTVKGLTYKWTASSKLKATPKGNKLVVAKLPKAGTYSAKVKAYNKKGKLLASAKYKVIVKAKPGIKVAMRTQNAQGAFTNANAKATKKGAMVMLDMRNAYWAWDNNTKTGFYSWTVKDLATGKTAKWNAKKGTFKKNAFIAGGSVAGGSCPVFMGQFNKKGTYEVIATVYHSNKAIDTATKKVTVK